MASIEKIGQAADSMKSMVEDDDLIDVIEDDDLEIEVVDDRPVADRRLPATEEARAAAEEDDLSEDEMRALSKRAQDRIKKLKWQYHEERREKEQARRMADEAVAHARRLQNERNREHSLLGETQKALTSVAQKRAESVLAEAERSLAEAYESGDATEIAKATKNLNQASLAATYAPQISRQVTKRWAEQNPEDQEEETPIHVPEPSQKAVSWSQRNNWFGRDKEMTSLAYGVHETLVESGVDPESDEYYSRLDTRMRELFPDRFEDGGGRVASSSQATAKADTVVAPATRNNGARPRKIRLTASQVRLAKRLGLTEKQYAEQLLKEGQV